MRLHEIAGAALDGLPIGAGDGGDVVAIGADEIDFVRLGQECVDAFGPHAQAVAAAGGFVGTCST